MDFAEEAIVKKFLRIREEFITNFFGEAQGKTQTPLRVKFGLWTMVCKSLDYGLDSLLQEEYNAITKNKTFKIFRTWSILPSVVNPL